MKLNDKNIMSFIYDTICKNTDSNGTNESKLLFDEISIKYKKLGKDYLSKSNWLLKINDILSKIDVDAAEKVKDFCFVLMNKYYNERDLKEVLGKTYSSKEALELLNKGFKVRSKNWIANQYLIRTKDKRLSSPNAQDCKALCFYLVNSLEVEFEIIR